MSTPLGAIVPAMRTLLLAASLAAILAAGCTKAEPPAPAPAPVPVVKTAAIPLVTVDEADASIAKHEATPVDANGDSTRKHMGVLPGAVLLTDSDGYDISELPADKSKSLVFYCGNDACSASHHAAKKAIAAGYEHVRVMPGGIAGWVSAGKQVQQI
jgi:rhodanese-related sulfurtransferase